MGPVVAAVPSRFWHFFLILNMGFVGINGQVNRWLNAHATYYGADQSPSTLGKYYN